jgi:hypothetical protein
LARCTSSDCVRQCVSPTVHVTGMSLRLLHQVCPKHSLSIIPHDEKRSRDSSRSNAILRLARCDGWKNDATGRKHGFLTLGLHSLVGAIRRDGSTLNGVKHAVVQVLRGIAGNDAYNPYLLLGLSVRWLVRHRPGRCRLTYSGRCLPQVFGQGFLLMAFFCSTVPLSYGASLACIQGQYDVYIWRSLPFASTLWLSRLFGTLCAGHPVIVTASSRRRHGTVTAEVGAIHGSQRKPRIRLF